MQGRLSSMAVPNLNGRASVGFSHSTYSLVGFVFCYQISAATNNYAGEAANGSVGRPRAAVGT